MPSENEPLLITSRFRVEEVAVGTGTGSPQRKAVIRHPGAVTIVPLVDADHVCLIRNSRVAVDRTLVELPAGTREPNETPEQTARRELIEETGFRGDRFSLLRTFYMSPGIMDERMYLFLAEGLTQVGPKREPGEEIENLIVPWVEALAMIDDGRIEDAKTLVGLLHFERLRGGS